MVHAHLMFSVESVPGALPPTRLSIAFAGTESGLIVRAEFVKVAEASGSYAAS